MTSYKIQFALIAFYAVLMATSILEKQYAKASYWLFAGCLTVSIMFMKG
jgi:hypothetical protein